ncbi:MAG: histidinol-phosphate transaminase [Planctomycetes bacterium]|nr:histidinol-phosphate transaminase [Planctomycetota bacterium]
MSYERPNIAKMHGYTPGEQPDDGKVVKLNTNENPYPPCEAVMKTLHAIGGDVLRKYPPPLAPRFRKVAAQVHKLHADNVIATNAGDELLRLAITTFVNPGEPIGTAEPSYSLYPVLAEINDSPVVRVPLNDDWSLTAGFADALNKAKVKLAFIVNPHAPSGVLRSVDTLAAVAEKFKGVLLIDEAYIDFVDPDLNHDATTLIDRFDNVLILRTLSKGYSLAGLRFGYGLGARSLIEPMLTKTKDSYNTDAIAQKLAAAALEHRADAAMSWHAVREERSRMVRELAAMGMTCPPSQSNFVLATVKNAADVYETLKQKRIFVRYFDQDRLRDKLRITIGTPEQNTALLDALREIL